MPEQTQKIKIFVASPSDVYEERALLKTVVAELNTTIAPYKKLSLELVKWESHATPSMGRPQSVINSQLGQYDIFVGIMWKRFGTPTGKAESGTEEEFQLAYKQWVKTKSIRILFYFCQKPFMPKRVDEIAQMQKVIEFKELLSKLGLTWEYLNSDEFPNVVRPHIARILLDTPPFAQKHDESIKKKVPDKDSLININVSDRIVMGDHVEAKIIRKKPRIFISGSTKNFALVNRLASFLDGMGIDIIQWDEDIFSAGRTIIEAFESSLSDIDAAIVVLENESPTPNIMFELGMIQGKYGRAKTIVLSPENAKLPSDLMGIIYLRYTTKNIEAILPNLYREFKHMGLINKER